MRTVRRLGRTLRGRFGAMLVLALVLGVLAPLSASSVTFSRDGAGELRVPSDGECPTIATPLPFEAWYNIEDLEERGFVDPKIQAPWDFAKKLSQLVCGAKAGSTIRIGMFFIRALGTMTATGQGIRPESDAELVYDALDWVKLNRGVKVGLVIDGGSLMNAEVKGLVSKRLAAIASIYYCTNGCLNLNAKTVYPQAINHEKFITLSDTTWANAEPGPHPAVLSMSGNIARSQFRNYSQELTLLYDDVKLYRLFDGRYGDMVRCSKSCSTNKGFSDQFSLSKQRNIWVDPIYRHYTDSGRGTAVSFAPQPRSAVDFYIQQFNDVDCAVDNKIRIAMFKLTDAKAKTMVGALARLQARGCDVRMLLTYQGGTTTISKTVAASLKKAKISTRCTVVAMHTKLILIGPLTLNTGRILVGTQNMSVPGLRYSEEHVITFDPRLATGDYVEPMRRLYGDYLDGWYELAQSTRSCS